jgi:hypothetical protein
MPTHYLELSVQSKCAVNAAYFKHTSQKLAQQGGCSSYKLLGSDMSQLLAKISSTFHH